MSKKVAVIGSGGREHALCYGLDASPQVEKVFAIPGNAGTAGLVKGENINLTDYTAIVEFCKDQALDLVVVAPDKENADGLTDMLREAGITAFGSSSDASQLEANKAFATEFMQDHDIALPPSVIVGDMQAAQDAIASFSGPDNSVVKASGLAGGKGVALLDTIEEADQFIQAIMDGKVEVDGFSGQLVIQQRYHGPEVSVFALSDGKTMKIIPLALQDHKRLLTGDKGPNTGGMGVYAPLPASMLNQTQWDSIVEIANKTMAGMQQAGAPYEGVLYLGIMLAEELHGQPIVIEYNARFGDPEAEVIVLLLLANQVNIYDMLFATAAGTLADFPMPETLKGSAITVCLAAEGYPVNPQKGQPILGLDLIYQDVITFHGGTKTLDGTLVTNGGRVLYVTAIGETLQTASDAANAAIGESGIHFAGMQYRTDIGHRAFATLR